MKASVLIVDDDAMIRKTVSDILTIKGYISIAATNGKTALDMTREQVPDVALIDLKLGDMSGLEVMKEIKKLSPNTECIVLTGYASQESAIEAVNLGAYSYVQKPWDMDQLLVTIRRAVEKREAANSLKESEERFRALVENANDIIYTHDPEGNFTSVNPAATRVYGYSAEELLHLNIAQIVAPEYLPLALQKLQERLEDSPQTAPYELLTHSKAGKPIWVEVSTRLLPRNDQPAEVLGIARDITERKRVEQQLEHSFVDLAETVSRAIGSRDPYTSGHQRRVAELAHLVGEKMRLDSNRLQGLYIGGLLHDIGKISIPASILAKPGKLTDEEWTLIRAHAKQGHNILKDTSLPWPIADMALHHHERLDGSGYPDRISGDKLSLENRILAVCDVVEAMSSYRPYRPAIGKEEVLEEIKAGRAIKYDPDVVDTMLEIIERGEFEFAWAKGASAPTKALTH